MSAEKKGATQKSKGQKDGPDKKKSYEILKDITAVTSTVQKAEGRKHQLIYASQLYGTFFAVSAKLIHSKKDKNILTGMYLNLINYKGLYNIGLLDRTKSAWNVHDGIASLVLHLKVNAGTHGHGEKNQMKISCKNTKLSDISELLVLRNLEKVNENSSLKHLQDRVFDSEFYYRDGSKIAKLERLDDAIVPSDHIDAKGKLKSATNIKILTSRPGSCETFISQLI